MHPHLPYGYFLVMSRIVLLPSYSLYIVKSLQCDGYGKALSKLLHVIAFCVYWCVGSGGLKAEGVKCRMGERKANMGWVGGCSFVLD